MEGTSTGWVIRWDDRGESKEGRVVVGRDEKGLGRAIEVLIWCCSLESASLLYISRQLRTPQSHASHGFSLALPIEVPTSSPTMGIEQRPLSCSRYCLHLRTWAGRRRHAGHSFVASIQRRILALLVVVTQASVQVPRVIATPGFRYLESSHAVGSPYIHVH